MALARETSEGLDWWRGDVIHDWWIISLTVGKMDQDESKRKIYDLGMEEETETIIGTWSEADLVREEREEFGKVAF